MTNKKLVTIRKAHHETGLSTSFFKQLIREGKLTRHKVNSATCISLEEFERLAQPGPPSVSKVRVQYVKSATASGSRILTKKGGKLS